MVDVVAALIFEGQNFLICQRPAHKARGLLWEFVGGKVEDGETPQEALSRECREELGVEIEVGEVFAEVTHKYPDIRVHLTVFKAQITEGVPALLEHAAIKWITAKDIPSYSFCPADRDILKKIAKEFSPDGRRKKRLGAKGESLAARHLKKNGYRILERNFRTPFCEVDIIAVKGDVMVFCEVKTRQSSSYGRPCEAVTPAKRRLYVRAAQSYISGKAENYTVRFDVIEIYCGQLNHIENAFTA